MQCAAMPSSPPPLATRPQHVAPLLCGRVCELACEDGGQEWGIECAVVSGASWAGVARYALRCCRGRGLGPLTTGQVICCELVHDGHGTYAAPLHPSQPQLSRALAELEGCSLAGVPPHECPSSAAQRPPAAKPTRASDASSMPNPAAPAAAVDVPDDSSLAAQPPLLALGLLAPDIATPSRHTEMHTPGSRRAHAAAPLRGSADTRAAHMLSTKRARAQESNRATPPSAQEGVRRRVLLARRERYEECSATDRARRARELAARARAAHEAWDPCEAVSVLRLAAAWLRAPVLGSGALPGSGEVFPEGVVESQSWVRRAILDALRVLDLEDPGTLRAVACELDAVRAALGAVAARRIRLIECRGGRQWTEILELLEAESSTRGTALVMCSVAREVPTDMERHGWSLGGEKRKRGRRHCSHGKFLYNCVICNPCNHGQQRRMCKVCNACPHGLVKWDCPQCRGCPHGRLKGKCRLCSACPHGRIRCECAICNRCPHGKAKVRCGQCRPCPHGKYRKFCLACVACPHGKFKHHCAACKACSHGKVKTSCVQCCPCPHGRLKRNCLECYGCPHGKYKHHCVACTACPHGKVKTNCVQCSPCPHGRLKRNCPECRGCPHGRRRDRCSLCKALAASRSAVLPEKASGD